jgi:DnaJ-domain-containing protein 1
MAPILSDEELALDPYALLGVTPDATEKQISTAYRQQSLKCHPDRVSALSCGLRVTDLVGLSDLFAHTQNPDNPDAGM